MIIKHPLLHPENAGAFFISLLPLGVLVVGADWYRQGAQLDQIPYHLTALAVVMAISGWWPLVYRLLPALSRAEPAWSLSRKLLLGVVLTVGFVAWGLTLLEGASLLRGWWQ